MIDHVKSFFNRYFPGGAPPLLLAMSGGRDSMVLAELLRLSGIAFEAAHLNYRLRGDESDKDCDHVVAWCRQQQIQLHQYVTTDEERDSLLQAGLQEKARNLRYTWFRSIISQRNGQYIVTAHHADDQAETMLFHFVRGSGIRGLAGMSEKQGDILRPLLKVDGSAIHNFAVKHGIIWRDDHSNATTDYSRNYIRHEVMPRLLEINPGLVSTLGRQAERYRLYQQWSESELARDLQDSIIVASHEEQVPISAFNKHTAPPLLLWYWLEKHGWPSTAIAEAEALLDTQPGKHLEYQGMTLTREREGLILTREKTVGIQATEIQVDSQALKYPISLTISKLNRPFDVVPGSQEAWLDLSTLDFPMVLRPWQAGDRFVPLGMTGSQKLSDFLVHQKVSSTGKAKVLVLESAGHIVWVLGHRISELHKVTPHTKTALRLQMGTG